MEPFDVLRREATKLERSLEDKIARYHQLAQKITTGSDHDHHQPSSSSLHHRSPITSANLLESAENGTLPSSPTSSMKDENLELEETNLAKDINRTLTLLSDLINTKMSPNATKSNNAHHSLLVKRYREIVYDCTNDFKKTNRAIMKKREQNDLFRGANNISNRKDDNEVEDPAMDALMRERNAIGNSLASATNVLNQASEIRSELRNQGASLKNVGSKVLVMASRVPGLNGLIENIRRKRGSDDKIVSVVIAVCILFTLWYVLG
jgi:Golgi SNAP receptor complex protein 1